MLIREAVLRVARPAGQEKKVRGQFLVREGVIVIAARAVACCRGLDIDWRLDETFNPNGGAIALGHKGGYAPVTACCGGGRGVATILERL